MITVPRVRRLLTMLFVFAVFFSIAVFVVVSLLREGSLDRTAASDSTDSKKRDSIFADSVRINHSGRFLRVAHKPELLPAQKQEYLLLFWVNLKSLPAIGERLVLLSKYSGAPPKISGYALGLDRDSNTTRPVLFWGDGTSSGRWYDFPEVSIVPNEWNLFVLHVHKDRFVGMYSARVSDSGISIVKFLGGHEINLKNPLSLGSAELVFGSPPGRDFRGKLGPLAIINPLSLGIDNIGPALEKYVKSPSDFSMLGSDSEIQLLIKNGRNDSSKNKHEVIVNY